MKTGNRILLPVVALAAALCSQACLAQRAGDNIFYLGYAEVVPSSSLGPVTNSNPLVTGTHATDGTSAQLQNASTTVLTWLHMFTDNVGTELTLGVPLTMNATLTAPNAGVVGLTSTAMTNAITQTASFPSLTAKYLFNSPSDKLRPYLGFGVNYTQFSNIQPNLSYNTVAAFASNGVALSSSWNPVYSAGLIYNLDAHWSINATIAYVPLTTNVTLTGSPAGLSNVATSTLTINPTDYSVKIGYKF